MTGARARRSNGTATEWQLHRLFDGVKILFMGGVALAEGIAILPPAAPQSAHFSHH
jgi:hypothetical protein